MIAPAGRSTRQCPPTVGVTAINSTLSGTKTARAKRCLRIA